MLTCSCLSSAHLEIDSNLNASCTESYLIFPGTQYKYVFLMRQVRRTLEPKESEKFGQSS